MKIILVLMLGLTIAGCTTTPTASPTGSTIPKTFFNCPEEGDYPDPDTMTNKEIVIFIEGLRKKLKVCNINMKKIEEYETRRKSR